jgi:hypothetical protein
MNTRNIEKGLGNEALFLYRSGIAALPMQLLERINPRQQHTPDFDLEETDTASDKAIRCRQCQHIITRPSHKLDVAGQHIYCFRNPADVDFVIGCFSLAEGCRTLGEATHEHSWFHGYSWRIALCGQCGEHLGWHYDNESGVRFFGLIINKLLD